MLLIVYEYEPAQLPRLMATIKHKRNAIVSVRENI